MNYRLKIINEIRLLDDAWRVKIGAIIFYFQL